jgi:GH15 family glucan-1,4-alpha-glucosidase
VVRTWPLLQWEAQFDSDELDAAALLMPIMGFLPASDERMRSTIEAIARELTEDGMVLRYLNDEGPNTDGLSGEEGTFVICSFWLVSCLAQAGEIEAIARELTEDGMVLRYLNDEGPNTDGLSGEEGTFVICSFWLVSCLAQAGEIEAPSGSSISCRATRTTSGCSRRR